MGGAGIKDIKKIKEFNEADRKYELHKPPKIL